MEEITPPRPCKRCKRRVVREEGLDHCLPCLRKIGDEYNVPDMRRRRYRKVPGEINLKLQWFDV